jgi:hypothetical protein
MESWPNLDYRPTSFQDVTLEEFPDFFQTCRIFSTDTILLSSPYSVQLLAFIGIANVPVQIQDYFLIPQAYNLVYNQTRETPYFRTLVLRRTEQWYSLVGFAYLVPVFASVRKESGHEFWSEANDDHEGNWSEANDDHEGKMLDDFGFSLQSFVIDLT